MARIVIEIGAFRLADGQIKNGEHLEIESEWRANDGPFIGYICLPSGGLAVTFS